VENDYNGFEIIERFFAGEEVDQLSWQILSHFTMDELRNVMQRVHIVDDVFTQEIAAEILRLVDTHKNVLALDMLDVLAIEHWYSLHDYEQLTCLRRWLDKLLDAVNENILTEDSTKEVYVLLDKMDQEGTQ
jgi:hypothetical protein